jgi:hypothetical protein
MDDKALQEMYKLYLNREKDWLTLWLNSASIFTSII